MALRILIVGAGAVGGYFGGRLAQAGRDVTFLVRPSRAKQLSQDGLRIISPHGDAVLSPKLISADKIDAPYDIIFLSVKAYALEAAMNDFAAAVGPEVARSKGLSPVVDKNETSRKHIPVRVHIGETFPSADRNTSARKSVGHRVRPGCAIAGWPDHPLSLSLEA